MQGSYFLGQLLPDVDLDDTAAVTAALDRYDEKRIPHTIQLTPSAVVPQRL